MGPILAKDFGAFLVKLINKYEYIQNNLDKFVFYMDNASIHKAKVLSQKIYKYINVLFGPPYTP